jgi:hypothetical protein
MLAGMQLAWSEFRSRERDSIRLSGGNRLDRPCLRAAARHGDAQKSSRLPPRAYLISHRGAPRGGARRLGQLRPAQISRSSLAPPCIPPL